jgi:SAM-dependent methyltransferase
MRLLGPVAGRDVLELGCGAGYYTRLLLAEGARHVHAVDFSAPMLSELPKENVTAMHGDAALVDPGRMFDLLLSAGMLEFVPDAEAVLSNAARLAAHGARFALLVPTNSLLGRGYRRFHKGHGFEIRLFDETQLRAIAAGSGWSFDRMCRAGPYSAAVRLTRVAGP